MKKSVAHLYISEAIRSLRFFLMGSSNCMYSVGCIDFVTNEFLTNSFFLGLKNSIQRILSCNSFTKR